MTEYPLRSMPSTKRLAWRRSRASASTGFALIAVLLLLVLVSAISVGLVLAVQAERRINSSDLEGNAAYYGAEAAMEKMTNDLADLYHTQQAPTSAQIVALATNPPALSDMQYAEYTFTVPTANNGTPISTTQNVSQGPFQGLIAQIIPVTLSVTAQRPGGQQVRMLRSVQVANIPVFQFAVFSDSDLGFFCGPTMDFTGRIQTNGNLFLSAVNPLTFHSQISAYGDVVRARLPNGYPSTTFCTGPVYIPNTTGGCDSGFKPNLQCLPISVVQGSVTAGPGSAANSLWTTISNTTFNRFITNAATGAKKLTLSFVQPGVLPIEIIKQPAPGESPTSTVGLSRLFNQAQIRILLANSTAELHPGGSAVDADDVPLANAGIYSNGVQVKGGGHTYFGEGLVSVDGDWVLPPGVSAGSAWPLIGGYLRVEIRLANGSYLGVTQEWLNLGFARDLRPPSSAHTNTVHPDAILLLQQQADFNNDGLISNGLNGETTAITGSGVVNNWMPLNFYDAREGEVRDVSLGTRSCAAGGVMNAVELDVYNLKKWLNGTIGSSGASVETTTQNGYVLYFSDRRGEITGPVAGRKLGEYGYEDNINPSDSTGVPNGVLNAAEDANLNGVLDTYGAAHIGDGFTGSASSNPTARMADCSTLGRKNRVTGPRHGLRLEDGAPGRLPTLASGLGGFTVASENPVYVQGNYNASDPTFSGTHADAAVIADAVTLLSSSYSDRSTFLFPTLAANRPATTSYFRLAVASGKNQSFPEPAWDVSAYYGTDGGMHNFMRFLEGWTGQTVYYKGSLVSLYYAQYGNGIFKCCNAVYTAPNRAFSFDTDFLNASQLPPGTPSFVDVENIGYSQDLRAY